MTGNSIIRNLVGLSLIKLSPRADIMMSLDRFQKQFICVTLIGLHHIRLLKMSLHICHRVMGTSTGGASFIRQQLHPEEIAEQDPRLGRFKKINGQCKGFTN